MHKGQFLMIMLLVIGIVFVGIIGFTSESVFDTVYEGNQITSLTVANDASENSTNTSVEIDDGG